MLLSGCARQKMLSPDRYARFYAKKALLSEYYINQRDSLEIHVAALYESEKVTPEQIRRFLEAMEKNPEGWVGVQECIVKEMARLNPRNSRPAKPAAKAETPVKGRPAPPAAKPQTH